MTFNQAAAAEVQVQRKRFGAMPDGTGVDRFTLTGSGLEVTLTSFGARLMGVVAPDRDGHPADVVLGASTLEDYLADRKTFAGAIVGRYGNRIAGGRFPLDGREIQIPPNDGANALHGGPKGFDRLVWEARELEDGVEFSLVSPAGDQGFPGTLRLSATYRLRGHAVEIDYEATTDAATVLNPTNHAYFNMAGGGDIQTQELTLMANAFTPVDGGLIPTGELRAVEGTPFDFRSPHTIGSRIGEADEQLRLGKGYDHNWAVEGVDGELRLAARFRDPVSGRVLEVETTEPGIQFYSGNFMDGSLRGREGVGYPYRTGICLETQHYPDSPNQPAFPGTILRPGETFQSRTVFRFLAE